jgi:hypothetical protein
MSNITFRCPGTGMVVQQWVEDEPDPARDAFVSIKCPACGKIHFINRLTHKLLGHEDGR